MSKYKNKKVVYDGRVFDSIKECNRYKELKLLERQGRVRELRLQVKYVLIPAQYETVKRYGKNGQRLKDSKRCLEKECSYIADFVYWDCRLLKDVVEDVKSEITRANPVYKIKKKLMLYVHGIKITEV